MYQLATKLQLTVLTLSLQNVHTQQQHEHSKSTPSGYIHVHLQHHSSLFILSKLPLLLRRAQHTPAGDRPQSNHPIISSNTMYCHTLCSPPSTTCQLSTPTITKRPSYTLTAASGASAPRGASALPSAIRVAQALHSSGGTSESPSPSSGPGGAAWTSW